MTEAVTIRPANADDCATLLHFIRQLAQYERDRERVVCTEADLKRDGFGPRPLFYALIAEQDGEPIGMATYLLAYSTSVGRPGVYVETLYMVPEWRKRGIGRRLLAQVAALAREQDAPLIMLHVARWNRARAFYRRLGFQEITGWRQMALRGAALDRLARRK